MTAIASYSDSLVPYFQLINGVDYPVPQLLFLDRVEMRVPRGPALCIQPIFELFRGPVCTR